MDTFNINDYHKNIKQNEGAPDSWCPLPWAGQHIQASGAYKVCCRTKNTIRDKKGMPLHVGETDWENIINNDVMKSVRKDMLAGRWASECGRCQKNFNSNMKSANILSRYKLAKDVEPKGYPGYIKAKNLTKSDGSISLKDFPLFFLDISFDNLCNLKCVTCSSALSTSWLKDDMAIFGKSYFDQSTKELVNESLIKNNGTQKNTSKHTVFPFHSLILSQIKKHIYQLRRVYISGGEPLLTKSFYKFLKICIENNAAKKITIEFNSNITHIPKPIWDMWKHFKKVQINFSIDGTGAVNDFIRYPSKWNIIENNISRFQKADGNFFCHIYTVVNILNIQHLPKLIEYVMSKNHSHVGSSIYPVIAYNSAVRPPFLNTNILEESFKEKIKTHFEKYKKKISNCDWQLKYGDSQITSWEEKIKSAYQIMDNSINFMQLNSFNKEELKKWKSHFIYFMDKLDRLRGLCWQKTFPELYESTEKWRNLKQPEKWERM